MYVHCIGVSFLLGVFMGTAATVSVVLEGKERISSSFGNFIGLFPDVLKVEGLGVPLVYSGWDSVYGINSFHDLGGDSS